MRPFPAVLMSLLLAAGVVAEVATGAVAATGVAGTTTDAKTGSGSASCRVKYLSAEHVYIDGGQAQGVALGDTLVVTRKGDRVALVVVVFVADHSASCQIVSQAEGIEVGDTALIKRGLVGEEAVINRPEQRQRTFAAYGESPVVRTGPVLTGSVSLQYYHSRNFDNTALTFDQPLLRFNVKVLDLFSPGHTFQAKGYLRYDRRGSRYSATVPQEEWRNRVHRISYSYVDERATYNYSVGRVSSRVVTGVGYIDGFMVDGRVAGSTRIGLFAGSEPEWRTSEPRFYMHKYGLYLRHSRGQPGVRRFELSVAAVGLYDRSEVSREYLYLSTLYRTGPRMDLYLSTEVDYNRSWRRERSGKTWSLTNIYLSGQYRMTDQVTTSLSYDNRRNFWSYRNRSLPDSLFDDSTRQGARLNARWKAGNHWSLHAHGGYRHLVAYAGDTWSYGFRLANYNGLYRGLLVSLRASGFTGPLLKGQNPSLRLSQAWGKGHRAFAGAGLYAYESNAITTPRHNYWVRAGAEVSLTTKLFCSGEYEYDWGDDTLGHRILAEIGYRF